MQDQHQHGRLKDLGDAGFPQHHGQGLIDTTSTYPAPLTLASLLLWPPSSVLTCILLVLSFLISSQFWLPLPFSCLSVLNLIPLLHSLVYIFDYLPVLTLFPPSYQCVYIFPSTFNCIYLCPSLYIPSSLSYKFICLM